MAEDYTTLRGRVVRLSKHKNSVFVGISNENGYQQALVDRVNFDDNPLAQGDIVALSGNSGYSDANKPTLFAEQYKVLLRPDHYTGQDNNLKKLLINRSRLTDIVRDTLKGRGAIEVDSAILSDVPGSSNIRPFKTTDIHGDDSYLRFTMELELKKYLALTQLPVFEIGKVFRNMGSSRRHFKEYSVVEAYLPYETLEDGMDIVEEIIQRCSDMLGNGRLEIPREDVLDAVREIAGTDLDERETKKLYSKQIKTQEGPIFLKNPPKKWSPLSVHLSDGTARDSELVYKGVGLAHICEENNDYEQVKRIMEEQQRKLTKVRDDAEIDPEFLEALRNGMPPSVGFCMGLDRILMAMTDEKNLRKVIPLK